MVSIFPPEPHISLVAVLCQHLPRYATRCYKRVVFYSFSSGARVNRHPSQCKGYWRPETISIFSAWCFLVTGISAVLVCRRGKDSWKNYAHGMTESYCCSVPNSVWIQYLANDIFNTRLKMLEHFRKYYKYNWLPPAECTEINTVATVNLNMVEVFLYGESICGHME